MPEILGHETNGTFRVIIENPDGSVRKEDHATFTEALVATIAPTQESVDHVRWVRSRLPSSPGNPGRDSIIIVANNPEIEEREYDLTDDTKSGRHLFVAVVSEAEYKIVNGIYDLDTLREFVNVLSEVIERQDRRCTMLEARRG